jgi:hypothetical protein|tara:strand:+ start:545 stop:748 length:204 start_codon:yes stop_codon:yes gene_type:complete
MEDYDLIAGELLQTTKDLIEICNKIYPQLDTGKFSDVENKALRDNIYLISEITQKNLNLMYPNRKQK